MSSSRTIKLTLQYDGARFCGWQSQRDARTVQGELAGAVERMVRRPIELVGAARTDSGVHAIGQVASFATTSSIPCRNFVSGLNRYLPRDVAVTQAEDVEVDFSARFSALGKWYRYSFFTSNSRDVFADRYAWRVAQTLDLEAMRTAASGLVGEHDFVAFATRSKSPPATTVRSVHAVEVSASARFFFVDVIGRGFLYNMVRIMAGTLYEVGRGKRSADSLGAALASCDRRQAGTTAEPQGLCLREVFYDQERLQAAIVECRQARPIDRSGPFCYPANRTLSSDSIEG